MAKQETRKECRFVKVTFTNPYTKTYILAKLVLFTVMQNNSNMFFIFKHDKLTIFLLLFRIINVIDINL